MCWKLQVDEVEEQDKHKLRKNGDGYIVDDEYETDSLSDALDYIKSFK